MAISSEKIVRIILGTFLLIIALNAFAGGYYGISRAKDLPLEWLQGSPFKSYFIPSLFLFVVIGGLSLFASIKVFLRKPGARKASLGSGAIILLWLSIQMAIIGYVSWMQPTTAAVALAILLLGWLYPRSLNNK